MTVVVGFDLQWLMNILPDIIVFSDFPRDQVPVILAPLLYPATEDIPTARLQSDIVLPSSMVSDKTECMHSLWES